MLITPFIKNEYATINAYMGTVDAKAVLNRHTGAIVTGDDQEPIEVITLNDLALSGYNLVADCIVSKPRLAKDHLIPEVFGLMEKSGAEMLAVYDQERMVGVVYKRDLTDYLCRSLEKQRSLVYSIAHDLKNPLSNVMSVTQLLELAEDGAIDAEYRDLVSMARDACYFATDMVNDLVYESENLKGGLHKESLNAYRLVQDCTDTFQLSLERKQIILKIFPATGQINLPGNRIKLLRAFGNLISNAIKFTPTAGQIEIRIVLLPGWVQLSFKDSGVGIPAAIGPHLFEKFTTAGRAGTQGETSTGLGLFITRNIIEQHGGKIWFESREEEGTTFHVQLPAG